MTRYYCQQSWESSPTPEKSYEKPGWTATTRKLQRELQFFTPLKLLWKKAFTQKEAAGRLGKTSTKNTKQRLDGCRRDR